MAHVSSTAVFVLGLTLLFPYVGETQTVDAEGGTADFEIEVFGETFGGFTTRIDGYFELRRRLERELPPVTVTEDVRRIRRGTRLLGNAIRDARRGAHQGEFFTAETSAEIKRVLAHLMNARIWALIMDENPGAFRHDVDSPYPEGAAHSTMPSILLAQLPQLPNDIHFGFVGPHLILFDLRANTIIDRLPDAIECADRCDD